MSDCQSRKNGNEVEGGYRVPSYWDVACRELAAGDPVLQYLIGRYRDVEFCSRGSAFETLLRAIVGQQISVKAAQSVWERLAAGLGEVSFQRVQGATEDELRACGLSRQKVRYIRDLADHFGSGLLDSGTFHQLEDEKLIARLCDVRGIGRWTAEMFLIFHLQRPDIFPLQDIGLIRAIERFYLGERVTDPTIQPEVRTLPQKGISRETAKRAEEVGERWRPWRTVATWYLWRSLDPFPVAY